jgi:hypothetical protein
MLKNLKKENDKLNNFQDFKTKLNELIKNENFIEFKNLMKINNFEQNELINEKKIMKSLMLDSSEFCNSDSSTKIEKLELSINKDYSTSTRNFNYSNQKVSSNAYTLGIAINQEIKNDSIKYTNLNQNQNKIKLPHLRLGVVITLNSLEIKRIFIEEMRK